MSKPHQFPTLRPAEARQLDLTCDRFEAAWKAGQRPCLEEYLGTVQEPLRTSLLRQLLFLDWDYRRRAGDEPRARDYHSRFSGDTAVIEDVCGEMTERSDSTEDHSKEPPGRYTPWSGVSPPEARGENGIAFATGSARYELLQEIGHGGIGIVYRGRDRHLGRELAIKVLREAYRDAPVARHRFIEEARVGSRLQHPAIVPVHELGWFDDRRPYFSMRLVEGRTFAALLHERGSPGHDLPRWLGIFEQVCQAMAYAHARGVVHRDLKPANVMVGAFGEVQVMDWGFAKQLPETEASQVGLLMGTPAYMPPEQAQGETALIDARADVFALGAILCEMLTGQPPYSGSGDEVCHRAAVGDLGGAHARLDACGAEEALRDLARRCLSTDRQTRPPDAGVVARAVTAYLASAQERLRQAQLDQAAAAARATEAEARARAQRQARRLTLALAAAAVVLVVLTAGGWWWQAQAQQAQALHQAVLDSKIEAALVEADHHLQRNAWPPAVAAAARARELRESGASDHWQQRLDDVQADLKLITELDNLYFHRATSGWPGWRARERIPVTRLAEAFARYGLCPGMNPEELAARITPHPRTVREAIIDGLENWWLCLRGRDAAVSDWLEGVLRALDQDGWRTEVWRALRERDRRWLEQFAAKTDLAGQPKARLFLLAEALIDVQAYDAAIAVLRAAQQRFPDDLWINLDLGDALVLRQPSNPTEALRFFSIANALRPELPLHVNLSFLLMQQGDWDGVILVSQKAVEHQPDSAEAHNNLGIGLARKGHREKAEAAYRKAIALKPDLANAHFNLALALDRCGKSDEALAEFQEATHLQPNDAHFHYEMGNALERRQQLDAALAAFDKTLALQPGHAAAHSQRGNLLMEKGRLDDALAALDQAIRADPTLDIAHSNRGKALLLQARRERAQGRPERAEVLMERAIAAFSRAVDLNPRSAPNQYNLASGLQGLADFPGAIAAYREAIRLDPNLAEAHCNLHTLLQEQGQFAEALTEIEQGHRLGSARSNWRYHSADWLQVAQRFVTLDARLPSILAGSAQPATVREQLEYADLCRRKGLNAAAARLYGGAFTAEPLLATPSRYQAACAAAMAGTGRGSDALRADSAEARQLRQQALDWLRADLARWTDRLDQAPDGRSTARSVLQRWRREKALAGIREPEELAQLPESERANYIRFWADVDNQLVRSYDRPPGK